MTGVVAVSASTRRVAPITASANWGAFSGNPTATSNTRTLTVPASNPGNLQLTFSAVGAPTVQYSKNGGAYTTFTSGTVVNFANGNDLTFRVTGGGGESASITVVDTATGTTVGTAPGAIV